MKKRLEILIFKPWQKLTLPVGDKTFSQMDKSKIFFSWIIFSNVRLLIFFCFS